MTTKATASKKKPAPAKATTAKKAAPASKVKKAAPAASKKKVAAKKVPEHVTPIKEPMNRTQLVAHIMEKMDERELSVTKKQAVAMLEILGSALKGSAHPKGSGVFTLPGVFKMVIRDIPAKKIPPIKKGTLVRKPGQTDLVPHEGRAAFTKPATRRVKIRPLGPLKMAALPDSAK